MIRALLPASPLVVDVIFKVASPVANSVPTRSSVERMPVDPFVLSSPLAPSAKIIVPIRSLEASFSRPFKVNQAPRRVTGAASLRRSARPAVPVLSKISLP